MNMESDLSPDPMDTTNALLMALVQLNINRTLVNDTNIVPLWKGPGSLDIWIQSLAYLGLGTSLLAAFGAVLGKQWLAHYKTTRFGRGTQEERGRLRHQKFLGIKKWQLEPFLDMLPILLQISLLCFAVSLTLNIYSLHHTLGYILILVTGVGILAYTITLVVAIVFSNSPFEGRISRSIRFFWLTICRYPLRRGMLYIRESRFFHSINRLVVNFHTRYGACWTTLEGLWNVGASRIGLGSNSHPEPTLLRPNSKLHFYNVIESSAIRWILETSTEPEIVNSAIELVPLVQWTADLTANFEFHLWRQVYGSQRRKYDSWAKAYIHLQVINEGSTLENPFYWLQVNALELAETPDTDDDFRAIRHALVLCKDRIDIDMSSLSLIIDQMDLTQPWLSFIFPLLIRRNRISLSQTNLLSAISALERCMVSYSQLSKRTLLNTLITMAVLLHVAVDPGLLIKMDKSDEIPSIFSSIFTALQSTLFVNNIFKEPLDANVESALRILPLFVKFCETMPFTHFFANPFSYLPMNNDISIWGIRLFLGCLSDQTVAKNHILTRSFLSLGLCTEDPWNGDHQANLLGLSNQNINLDYMFQYMKQLRKDQDGEALLHILYIMGTLDWGVEDPNLDISLYLTLLAECMESKRLNYMAIRALCSLQDHHIMNTRNKSTMVILSHSITTVESISFPSNESWHVRWNAEPSLHFFQSRSILYLRLLLRVAKDTDWYGCLLETGHFERAIGFMDSMDSMDSIDTTGKTDGWEDERIREHLNLIAGLFQSIWVGAPDVSTTSSDTMRRIKDLIHQSWKSVHAWSQYHRRRPHTNSDDTAKSLMDSTICLINLTSHWDMFWDLEDLPKLKDKVHAMKDEVEGDPSALLRLKDSPDFTRLVQEQLLPSISSLLQKLEDRWLQLSDGVRPDSIAESETSVQTN